MSAQGNLLRKKCISGIRIVSATRLIPNYYDFGRYESVSAARLIPNHYDLGYLESVSVWFVTRGYQQALIPAD